MTDEHTGTCIYDKGRFELRETDKAIIDLKGDFPPIMIASDTVDDGSEPNCADTRSVLHLLNELSDNNPNEERHWYLKKMLDKAWTQYHEQKEENEELKQQIEDFKAIDDDEFIETEHINNIYKKLGFKGVIDYAKDKLQQYGVVKEVEKGLWVMVTGGWSDNEFWLDCLNNLTSIFAMKHYCAYERGGAFYYTEKAHDKIEIRLKGDDVNEKIKPSI